ncbi:MAG: ATP-binding protein [Anaerolineales bacterium]
MIDFFRKHLGAKLFLSYLLVIVAGGIVLMLTTRFTAPTAFQRHLGMMGHMEDGNMMGNPGIQTGPGMRRGQDNSQGSGYASELYINFQQSLSEALTWAALAAGTAALGLSLFLSQRVVRPVRAMRQASQRIAAGEYSERVQEHGTDELGQLAHSFNQMAEQLQHTEDMRRQLIGDVAHELRTPLTFIKGSIEGLLDNVLPASTETYQQIHQEAERLNRLVSDLQELSRVEAGAYELDLREVRIEDLIEATTKRLAQQFAEKNVRLVVDKKREQPPVRADADRIIQVLTNLLTNALHFTPEAGEVSISISRVDKFLHISVRDSGEGIPAEHLPHVFTRFYRVDKSRSRQAGGSGIGLTIAKHLVEAHGGRIWAESDGPGEGSTFTFTLPV